MEKLEQHGRARSRRSIFSPRSIVRFPNPLRDSNRTPSFAKIACIASYFRYRRRLSLCAMTHTTPHASVYFSLGYVTRSIPLISRYLTILFENTRTFVTALIQFLFQITFLSSQTAVVKLDLISQDLTLT